MFAELYLKNGFFPNLGYKALEDGAEVELLKTGQNKNGLTFFGIQQFNPGLVLACIVNVNFIVVRVYVAVKCV